MAQNNLNKRTLELEDKNEKDFNRKSGTISKSKKGNRRFQKMNFKGKKTNDPNWHGKNSQIVKDLCSLPFNTMLGFPPSFDGTTKYTLGVIRSVFVDWFAGVSEDYRSFLNTSATNLWEFIRSRNSGATNYQSADIFVNVILGCLDMFATAIYLGSCFDYVDMYSVFNRMIPKTVFEMRKINYEDFVNNIANYRGRFNLLLAKMSAVVIPDQFPLYHWVMSMYQEIYKDRDSETGREQLIVPVKAGYHIFDATGDPQGGMIREISLKDLNPAVSSHDLKFFVTRDCTPLKFSTYLNILEMQINSIVTDEDCNIIFGDLIKAYGSEGKFFKFSPQSEGVSKKPVYSEEFLSQYHNAIFAPVPSIEGSTIYSDETVQGLTYNNVIKQDGNGYLITEYGYKLEAGSATELLKSYFKSSNDFVIDTNDLNPDSDKVMTMTRFHNRFYVEAGASLADDSWLRIAASSAIILFDGQVATVTADGPTKYSIAQFYDSTVNPKIALFSNFDWAPIMYVREGSGANNVYLLGDINNIQPVKQDTIARIHDVDFASLYDVPFTGKF